MNEYENYKLLRAAEKGSLTQTKKALENGADLLCQNKDGRNAVMLATINNHDSVVKELIDYGCWVGQEDNLGDNAFRIARRENKSCADMLHEAITKEVMNSSADIGEGMRAWSEQEMDTLRTIEEYEHKKKHNNSFNSFDFDYERYSKTRLKNSLIFWFVLIFIVGIVVGFLINKFIK